MFGTGGRCLSPIFFTHRLNAYCDITDGLPWPGVGRGRGLGQTYKGAGFAVIHPVVEEILNHSDSRHQLFPQGHRSFFAIQSPFRFFIALVFLSISGAITIVG
jgi:hypothetical protein